MHDSIALAAAQYSSLAIRTVGLLAVSLLVVLSLYLVGFLICITSSNRHYHEARQDKRQ